MLPNHTRKELWVEELTKRALHEEAPPSACPRNLQVEVGSVHAAARFILQR